MFKNEDLTRIAALIGKTPDEFKKLYEDEKEHEIEIPTLFTEAEAKAAAETKYKAGRKAEREIAAKELAKNLGIEVESKDLKKVAETYASKMVNEAKLPADEQVKALKADKEKLQGLVTESEKKLKEVENNFKQKLFRYELKQQVQNSIPDKTLIPKADVTDLFMMKYDITKDEEGNTIISKDGTVLKDKLENPVKLELAVQDFATGYLAKPNLPDGGSGGKLPDKFSKLSEAAKWAKENNVVINSDKFNEILSKRKADDFEFDEVPEEYI